MARIVWSVDPLAVSRLGQAEAAPPLTKKQLARIGIPAHKIPRVQQELARLTGGASISATMLESAGELLDQADKFKKTLA